MVAQFVAVVVVFFFHKSDFPRKVNGNGRQKTVNVIIQHCANSRAKHSRTRRKRLHCRLGYSTSLTATLYGQGKAIATIQVATMKNGHCLLVMRSGTKWNYNSAKSIHCYQNKALIIHKHSKIVF